MQAFPADVVNSPWTSTLEDVFDLNSFIVKGSKLSARSYEEDGRNPALVGTTAVMQRPSWLCSLDTVGAPSLGETPYDDV